MYSAGLVQFSSYCNVSIWRILPFSRYTITRTDKEYLCLFVLLTDLVRMCIVASNFGPNQPRKWRSAGGSRLLKNYRTACHFDWNCIISWYPSWFVSCWQCWRLLWSYMAVMKNVKKWARFWGWHTSTRRVTRSDWRCYWIRLNELCKIDILRLSWAEVSHCSLLQEMGFNIHSL